MARFGAIDSAFVDAEQSAAGHLIDDEIVTF